jgi:cellulose biosynthesis protein BcsQ
MFASIFAADAASISIPLTWLYGVLGAGLVALLGIGWKKAWPYMYAHFSAVWRLRRAEKALEETSPGLWLAPSIPINPPNGYQRSIEKSKPIIVVANLKGGVGKTTTVANLIGHYGLKKHKRVLAIDIDFQGSLSAVVLCQADYDQALSEQIDGSPSKAAQLICGKDATWVRNVSNQVDGVGSARCIPSYYSLATMENRLMVEWLIAKRKEDIRYNLARTLHDPGIQDNFDLVIIDSPPRLTTASIQAFCAATHVLVPTVLDGLSAEATAGFVDQLATNKSLWPHLKLLGAFGNMTTNCTADLEGNFIDGRLRAFEADAQSSLSDTMKLAMADAGPALRTAQDAPVFPANCFIPQKAELGREAGNRIAYQPSGGGAAVQEVSRAFDRLADEIDRRILITPTS